MATLDIVTLAEAKAELNLGSATGNDAELQTYITAVSQRLDDMSLCGPVVVRSVTETYYPDDYASGRLILRSAPASKTAATTITSVTEYTGGSAQALAVEGLTTSTAYDYTFDQRTGILSRRASWGWAPFGSQAVVVVYSAGRYANTASVAEKFKAAAKITVAHLWRREQGLRGSTQYGVTEDADFGSLVPYGFSIPDAALEFVRDELQMSAVG